MFRIGYDAKRLFNNFTGLGNYARTIVENVSEFYPENEYYLYTTKVRVNPRTKPFINRSKYLICKPLHPFKSLWRTFTIVNSLREHNVQLFHGLSHEIPMGVTASGVKTIVTIHDLIFKHYPNQYSVFDRKMYDFKFRYACENANRIIAISNATKNDIIKFYNIDPNKIRVIYQTCDDSFKTRATLELRKQVKKEFKLPDRFMLYVGSVIERKNLLGLVKALHLIPSENRIPLVVIGDGTTYLAQVKAYLDANELNNWVHFLEEVPFSYFPAIYQSAELMVYPSIYEGFGIPVLEGLYSKIPVITSKTSSLPEAGGNAALLIDPFKPEEIAEAIQNVLNDSDLRELMLERATEHLKKFDAEILTRNLMRNYKELIVE